MSLVHIGADHRGINLKKSISEFLRESGYQVIDQGFNEYDRQDDYSEIAIKLAEKVVGDKVKGILLCVKIQKM